MNTQQPKQKKIALWRKILIWVLVVGMVLPMLIALTNLFAVTQNDINQARKKIEEYKLKQEETEAELVLIRGNKEAAMEQKLLLDKKINDCNEEIDLILGVISELEMRIDDGKTKLEEMTEEKERLYEAFKQRLRIMYEDSNISYLSVILQAESIYDLLNRADQVGSILKNDKDLIASLEEVCTEIELTTSALEIDLEDSKLMYANLAVAKSQLEKDFNESLDVMYAFEHEEEITAASLATYEKLWEEAQEREQKLVKELEEQRKREQEELRLKAEAERKRLEEELKNRTYIWPTPGFYYITSQYGYRTHPITKKLSFHNGIDIGATYGSRINSIAAGTVVENRYDSAYGNLVKVDHGGGLISFYGHMASRSKLAVGTKVVKGGLIGYIGSTGLSTGPHLHLTIYKNGVTVNPLTIVKP